MLLELLPDWFTARSHTKRVGRESLPDKGPYQANSWERVLARDRAIIAG